MLNTRRSLDVSSANPGGSSQAQVVWLVVNDENICLEITGIHLISSDEVM